MSGDQYSCCVFAGVFLTGLQSCDIIGYAGCCVGWMGNFLKPELGGRERSQRLQLPFLIRGEKQLPASPTPDPIPREAVREATGVTASWAVNDNPSSHTHLACCVTLHSNTKCYFVSSCIFCLVASCRNLKTCWKDRCLWHRTPFRDPWEKLCDPPKIKKKSCPKAMSWQPTWKGLMST